MSNYIKHLWLSRRRYKYRANGNILLDKHHAIYFYIPKVACSSIKIAVSNEIGVKPPAPDKPSKYPHLRNYPSVEKSHILESYSNYTRFVFVRNPWDRILSCYLNKVKRYYDGELIGKPTPSLVKTLFSKNTKHVSFPEFLEVISEIPDESADGHFKSQVCFVTDHDGRLLTNWIGYFENLAEDYERLANELGFSNKSLPHLLPSKRSKKYLDHYDTYTRKLVEKRYEQDIDLFKYSF